MPVLARTCLWLCALAGGLAHASPLPREARNLTNGMRFSLSFSVVAEAPSDPKIMYLGTSNGRVHVSHDGGESWEETTAITTRKQYLGAIRGASLTGDVGTDPISVYGVPAFSAWILNNADGEVTTVGDDNAPGRDYSDVQRPRLYGNRGFELPVEGDGPTMGGGSGSSARFGVGLREGAPWLASAVRDLRGWGVGINVKQTLALRGFGSTWINWLDVDPVDPNVVLAATGDGLRISTDGGYSWPVVLSGATDDESDTVVVIRHPRNADRLFVGTELGLHVSSDRGRTFEKLIEPMVVSSSIRWIEVHPTDDQTWLVAMDWGVVRTTDDGQSFDLIHRSSWPDLGFTRYAIYDPHDPKRILLGTKDGLLISEDDGQSFDRAGGLQFVAQDTYALAAGPAPGQFLAMTPRDLWETTDGGKSWQIVYFGDMQWTNSFARYRRDTQGDVLAVTEGEVLSLEQPEGRDIPAGVRRQVADLMQREPTLEATVAAARQRFGADIADQVAYRARARVATLLPDLVAGFYSFNNTYPDGRIFADGSFGGDDFIFARDRQYTMRPQWFVTGNWDLSRLMHTQSEALVGRVAGVGRSLEWKVRSAVIALYQERRRLQISELVAPPQAQRSQLMRRLRLEELTAHLNALTGDLFEPFDAL
ncbi:MAG: hypothetical protein KC613_10680 [Myxococcales bacterium]|nr:hypothetical protein [Myxococcales bacterium]